MISTNKIISLITEQLVTITIFIRGEKIKTREILHSNTKILIGFILLCKIEYGAIRFFFY